MTDHLYKLMRGDKVIKNDNVFADHGDFLLRLDHSGDYYLEALI